VVRIKGARAARVDPVLLCAHPRREDLDRGAPGLDTTFVCHGLPVGTTVWFRFRTFSKGVNGDPSRMVSFVVHRPLRDGHPRHRYLFQPQQKTAARDVPPSGSFDRAYATFDRAHAAVAPYNGPFAQAYEAFAPYNGPFAR
jgi:hypothetical protein